MKLQKPAILGVNADVQGNGGDLVLKRIIFIAKYMFYTLVMAALYGYTAFFLIYRQLTDGSLLYTYIGNMVLIIIFLTIDYIIHGVLQSKGFIITEKNYRFARFLYLDSLVSFKTTVYLFYIIVLVVSQIISFRPTPANAEIANFFTTIEYGILFVIALDTLIGSVFKDMERIDGITAKFKGFINEKTIEKTRR